MTIHYNINLHAPIEGFVMCVQKLAYRGSFFPLSKGGRIDKICIGFGNSWFDLGSNLWVTISI